MTEFQTYLGQPHADKAALDAGNSLILGPSANPMTKDIGMMVMHKTDGYYVIIFHHERGAHDDKAFTVRGKIWYEARLINCMSVMHSTNFSNLVELMQMKLDL